jgi:hypothetical protein
MKVSEGRGIHVKSSSKGTKKTREVSAAPSSPEPVAQTPQSGGNGFDLLGLGSIGSVWIPYLLFSHLLRPLPLLVEYLTILVPPSRSFSLAYPRTTLLARVCKSIRCSLCTKIKLSCECSSLIIPRVLWTPSLFDSKGTCTFRYDLLWLIHLKFWCRPSLTSSCHFSFGTGHPRKGQCYGYPWRR